jgi:hypothetical protein
LEPRRRDFVIVIAGPSFNAAIVTQRSRVAVTCPQLSHAYHRVAKQWRVGNDVENLGQRGGDDFRLESI